MLPSVFYHKRKTSQALTMDSWSCIPPENHSSATSSWVGLCMHRGTNHRDSTETNKSWPLRPDKISFQGTMTNKNLHNKGKISFRVFQKISKQSHLKNGRLFSVYTLAVVCCVLKTLQALDLTYCFTLPYVFQALKNFCGNLILLFLEHLAVSWSPQTTMLNSRTECAFLRHPLPSGFLQK